jgi:hypothetical protein
MVRRRGIWPHGGLAAGVAGTLALEAARGFVDNTCAEMARNAGGHRCGGACGRVASPARARASPGSRPALVLEFGWIAFHLAHGVDADSDSARALPREGNAFLHRAYPESEYPPGAILLFALDVLLGGGSTRVAHAFLMIPFQIAVVAGIWSFRTRWSAWLAPVAALWPLNAFFWEYQPTVTSFTSGRRITQIVLVVPGAGTTLSGFRPPTGFVPV